MTTEFIAAQLATTQAELSIPILNRAKWNALCEDRRMLLHLQERAAQSGFPGVRVELQEIAEGRSSVPNIGSSRGKAAEYLRRWAEKLDVLD